MTSLSQVRPKKILIVEDEPALLEFYLLLLRKENFIAEGVCDGCLALKKVISETFDLILLDIMLPKVDGIELLKKINAKGKKVPKIILLTNLDQGSIFQFAAKLGVADVLIKSDTSPEEFIQKVRKLIDRD